MMDTEICEVTVTGPTGDLLPAIGRAVVDARLAASVNVFNAHVESTYWWQGRIQSAMEIRLHLLTRTDLINDLVAFVRARHPYEVPNVTAMPILGGNAAFIRWVKNETRSVETTNDDAPIAPNDPA
jgi:periplasmic divalent cation tolerance protein